MANQTKTEKAITKGIGYLADKQKTDGSFTSHSSPNPKPFKNSTTYLTTFAPAIVLGALSRLDSAQDINNRLATWLLDQKSPHWSFNYWAKNAPERNTQPYPDDLDDTFCALIGLCRHNPQLINAECLASVTKLLVATESKVGGPYRTWLVPKNSSKVWLDQDLAVNSNIACFLSLIGAPLPNLTKLMEKSIKKGQFQSPYYPNAYPIIYFVARAYRGPHQSTLANHLLSSVHNGYWQSPLYTALAVSALRQTGYTASLESAVSYLLAKQKTDGSWPAEAFCIDPSQNGQTHYNGSAELSTALVLEGLNFAKQGAKEKPVLKENRQAPKQEQKNTTQVLDAAHSQIKHLGTDLQAGCQQMLDALANAKEGREIILLPRLFAASLTQPFDSDELFVPLGLANLYGWAAYTIYDDFLDGEGKPNQLSVANTAMRYSLDNFYQALPHSPTFHTRVKQTFDIIDGANAWELAHCRFDVNDNTIKIAKLPDYGQLERLAERSLGHGLSIIGVLTSAGAQPEVINDVGQAFRHYLVARQLRDDLHDWAQDTRAGQINFVAKTILQELKTKPGNHDLTELIPQMEHQFWHHSLTTVCRVISQHTKQGRNHISKTKYLKTPNILTHLFDDIDDSIKITKTEQTNAKKFLHAYSNG